MKLSFILDKEVRPLVRMVLSVGYSRSTQACRSLSIFVVATLLLGGVSACDQGNTIGSGVSAANRTDAGMGDLRDSFFTENLAEYRPKDEGKEQAVRALNVFRDASERFDISDIEQLLTDDFELHYNYSYEGDKELLTLKQSRSDFLHKRREWRPRTDGALDIVMSVKAISYSEDKKLIFVWSTSTHKSKYFNPKFVEFYVFENINNQQLIKLIVMTPVYPETTEHYDVDVYFAELNDPYYDLAYTDIRRHLIALGPDAAFEKYVKRFTKRAPTKALQEKIPIVIIFREPPPEGSAIDIVETQIGSVGNEFRSFQRVSRYGDPYYFLANGGWRGRGYSVVVKVLVDDVLIARETLYMPR